MPSSNLRTDYKRRSVENFLKKTRNECNQITKMKKEIIKAEDYGLAKSKGDELTVGLKVVRAERDLLIAEFEEVSKLEILEENIPKFKGLRLRISKNRTQGVNKWHKTNKEYFLTGGKFVDAIKNRENAINEGMEVKLLEAEKHFENIEKERLKKLQQERVELISEYIEDANERDLSYMDEDVWGAYLWAKKKAHADKLEAKLKLEKEIQARLKAEAEERERIKKENERLKAEAQEKERLAKIEEEKRAIAEEARLKKEAEALRKVEQQQREEREEAERKLNEERLKRERAEKEARERAEALEAETRKRQEEAERIKKEESDKVQAELNKGDSEKVKDLIKDLEVLKTKYSFDSDNNIKMYKSVGVLIEKVVGHINKL